MDGALEENAAAWVRFCPPAEGHPGWVLAPDTVVEGRSAAELVGSWRDDDLTMDCVRTTRNFEIQIGWSDGTISTLGADRDLALVAPSDECVPSRVAASLVRSIGTGRQATYAAATPQLWPACPDRLTPAGLAADGASAADLGWFDEQPRSRQPILHTATQPGITDCSGTVQPSFVIVLEDLTGTRRAVSIDGTSCGAVAATVGAPPEESYLGSDHRVTELLTSAG